MSDSRRVEITDGDATFVAVLNDSATADAVWEALPFDGRAQLWGDEIYFSIPVSAELDSAASDVVEVGAVAYWPPGSALCLFWGPTPASRADECRAASPVNVFGALEGDAGALGTVRAGATLQLRRAV